jgi:hypothetical protein
MATSYAYQREAQGYAVWTIGVSGDRKDLVAYARTARDAQRIVDRLYATRERKNP